MIDVSLIKVAWNKALTSFQVFPPNNGQVKFLCGSGGSFCLKLHPQTTIHYWINFMTNTSVDAITDAVNNTNNNALYSIINPVRKYLLLQFYTLILFVNIRISLCLYQIQKFSLYCCWHVVTTASTPLICILFYGVLVVNECVTEY